MDLKQRIFTYILYIAGVAVVVFYGISQYRQWEEACSGIPDVVSSISVNNYHYLTVIANCKKIDDKEAFARKIIDMCQQNAFRSVKFSTDVNGYPSGLDINVYLKNNDIENNKPVCKIKFVTDEYGGDYDIRNDAAWYHLYLDGEEISVLQSNDIES